MLLGGLQKTTLIDFPGRVGCTIFTLGCNFRCPFCHNKDLVSRALFNQANLELIKVKDFLAWVKQRKKILDGVCITGGEPTIQPDLAKFCRQLKNLDLEVKLDSNGSNPRVLKSLIKAKLVDFIAMDVKSAFSEYEKVVNFQFPISNVQKSIKLILKSGLEYELRTTLVPTIHNQAGLIQLAKDLVALAKSTGVKASEINYFLQQFQPENCLDSKFLKLEPFPNLKLKQFLKAIKPILPQTKIRGLD